MAASISNPRSMLLLSFLLAVAGKVVPTGDRVSNDEGKGLLDFEFIMTVVGCALLVVAVLIAIKIALTNAPAADADANSEDKSFTRSWPAVASYVTLGIILITFNKYMYLPAAQGGFSFPCPMTLSWWHMVMACVVTQVIKHVRPDLMPAVRDKTLDSWAIVTIVVPIGVVFSSYLLISHLAFSYLPISFVRMLKSAGPIAVHAISSAAGFEKITSASLTAIAFVVLGIFTANVTGTAFDVIGIALQLIAFVLHGVRLVLFKLLMSSKTAALDALSGMYYYSLIAAVTLVFPMLYFERELFMTALGEVQPMFFGILVLNGAIAFALNLTLLSLFSKLSATSVALASVSRDILLTFFFVFVFHTPVTKMKVAGFLVALMGVKLWDQTKSRPDAFNRAFGLKSDETTPLVK